MRIKVTEENLGKLSHKDKVRFSLFCAKQVEHLTTKETKACIKVTEQWLKGEASQEECRKAADAAYAVYDAVAYAARTAAANAAFAAHAVYTVANAANAAAVEESNKTKITKEQEEYLYELINIDLIVEKNLLT